MEIAENATNKWHYASPHFDLSRVQLLHFPSNFPCHESFISFGLLCKFKFLRLTYLLKKLVRHFDLIFVFGVDVSYFFTAAEAKLVSVSVENLLKFLFDVRNFFFTEIIIFITSSNWFRNTFSVGKTLPNNQSLKSSNCLVNIRKKLCFVLIYLGWGVVVPISFFTFMLDLLLNSVSNVNTRLELFFNLFHGSQSFESLALKRCLHRTKHSYYRFNVFKLVQ